MAAVVDAVVAGRVTEAALTAYFAVRWAMASALVFRASAFTLPTRS